MKELTQILRFLLGGGWWTLWYGLFYLIVITGNFIWFNELYEWTKKGQSGPGGGAVFIGLVSMGGIPLLAFFCLHMFLAFFRSTNSLIYLFLFGLFVFLAMLVWMIAGSASIAEARYSALVWYYAALLVFIFINLALLWVSRQKSELSSILPFLP